MADLEDHIVAGIDTAIDGILPLVLSDNVLEEYDRELTGSAVGSISRGMVDILWKSRMTALLLIRRYL